VQHCCTAKKKGLRPECAAARAGAMKPFNVALH